MSETKKILGDKRRNLLVEWLSTSNEPLTGGELAKRTNVSRQVIVQDISILKAKKHPIIATAQGYILVKSTPSTKVTRIIACKHSPEQTKEELFILVDHGVTIRDVIVEHAIYGEITANLMLSTRKEVEMFFEKLETTNSSLLSELTNGVHLHTIEADNLHQLEKAIESLEQKQFILKD
ncbi:transcription repressor NadR [Halalkalibacter krulwichiae]|uniref:Transcription repressor NadR n=1 Tax=Halalkalibacter krulwichiae TaxID=199441 RepID=A0A1X9M714_9BACI|nr:transcription repressor NadR [Halalkalibacter krulwichiae]ARK29197.1 Transcription repressor NadR [Halalkalibacter krulwichiae]